MQIQQIRDKEFRRVLAIRKENEYNLDIGMSGTVGTLVVMRGSSVIYGNVGDCLACLSRNSPAGTFEANFTNESMILTKPYHQPEDMTEKMRIFRRKGEIRGMDNNKNKEAEKVEPAVPVSTEDQDAEEEIEEKQDF